MNQAAQIRRMAGHTYSVRARVYACAQRSTNSQLPTPDPRPQTLNPQASSPKPRTPNPKPQTRPVPLTAFQLEARALFDDEVVSSRVTARDPDLKIPLFWLESEMTILTQKVTFNSSKWTCQRAFASVCVHAGRERVVFLAL